MDFANVLFAGPCNRACPFCIGHALPDAVNAPNLDTFPPHGLDAFVDAVVEHGVREIVFTGTTTDPQLYRHELRLLELLRRRLPPDRRYSLHTNGVLALRKLDAFNAYDRACLSLPTLDPDVYERMMGSRRVPDLEAILAAATIPVKVSCIVNEANAHEVEGFLRQCRDRGVRRAVVRRLHGDRRRFPVLEDRAPVAWFRGNPVHDLEGLEVTVWSFEATAMRSLNLFADGTLGTSYLLTETRELPETA